MATTYNNAQIGVVDASGNLNVIYPITKATNVAYKSTNVDAKLTSLQSAVDTLNSKITDSGWINLGSGCDYRKVNGIVTVIFDGYTIPTPSPSSPCMPSGYQPAEITMNTISTASSGWTEQTDYLYTVAIYSSSYSRPGMIICYSSGSIKVYGSITYPV